MSNPIRIAIDARPLSGPMCGYTVYLCSVISCLRSAGLQLTLLSNQPLQPYYDEAQGLELNVFGTTHQLGWELRDLPAWLRAANPEIYFTGANRGIPVRKNKQTQYVLGLLDVIPYLFYKNYFLSQWKTLLRHPSRNAETASQLVSVARADAILTISRQSAADIRRIFRRRNVTSHLIRLKDVDEADHHETSEKPEPYFTYLGGIDYRKKVDILLEAFALFLVRHPNYRLFLVGSNYRALQPLIERLNLGAHVVLTGFVDDESKYRILRESQAMVYPSLYEGYGMAIAEGFQAGIPVIAGRGGSQEEICGGAARHIDPLSAPDIAAAMEEMLDPTVRAAWIASGREQLNRLTDPAIERGLVEFFVEQGRRATIRRREHPAP